jgi:arylsulfatase A-like enzyme
MWMVSRPKRGPAIRHSPERPPERSSGTPESGRRLGPLDVLVLSAWCGLAAGELEVAARVLYKHWSATNQLYGMTRHFVWVVPLVDLSLFLGMGLSWAVATKLWPRRAGWLGLRFIVAVAILPALLIAGPRIYLVAWLTFALGIASWLAGVLERHAAGLRRRLILSFPVLLGVVLVQAGAIVGGDRLAQSREDGRPLPPSDSPNVLLVVLDTVRADHLSLHGYERRTSPALERLAARGIRFDRARAAAPWTLASHATLFTGRWPHELDARWMHPMLNGNVPTLAEYLGTLGYATAGFVGNTFYCSYDSGLNRGFTHFEDYIFETFETVRSALLVDIVLKDLNEIGPALSPHFPMVSWLFPGGLVPREFAVGERKDAGVVNREFLDWLSRRRQPRRPFFAFLNYTDAHTPYLLPLDAECRFGPGPQTEADFLLLDAWPRLDKRRVPEQGQVLVRDAYDNCLAYLDTRLGELVDELQRRGVLDRTIVIVTADHGEGFGEHELFDHGQSLYRTEIRVPLVMVLPARDRPRVAIGEPVSLRGIPATIADLVSPGTKSPFPGRSLIGAWRGTSPAPSAPHPDDVVLSELPAPNPNDPNQGRSPAYRGPLISLAEGDFVYIRNEGDGGEELFDEHEDTHELINRAGAAAMSPVLQRFRDRLRRATGHAPTAADIGGPSGPTPRPRSRTVVADGAGFRSARGR